MIGTISVAAVKRLTKMWHFNPDSIFLAANSDCSKVID